MSPRRVREQKGGPGGPRRLPGEGYSCKHRRVFPRLHADVQNAAGLKLLQELDDQSFLVAVRSKLVGAAHVKSKSTTQRHRQSELKTVLSKGEVMVPQMAQERHRIALLEKKAQESVRACAERTNAVTHFVSFLQPLPP